MLIALNQNRVLEIDDADAPLVLSYRWTADRSDKCWYAYSHEYVNGKRRKIAIHRLLMGLVRGDKRHVDHIDGDGLNNKRSNLRIATVAENAWNRAKHIATSSRYKGVSLRGNINLAKRWRTSLCVNGRVVRLGDFATEHEAATAYNSAAVEAFGARARLNVLVTI